MPLHEPFYKLLLLLQATLRQVLHPLPHLLLLHQVEARAAPREEVPLPSRQLQAQHQVDLSLLIPLLLVVLHPLLHLHLLRVRLEVQVALLPSHQHQAPLLEDLSHLILLLLLLHLHHLLLLLLERAKAKAHQPGKPFRVALLLPLLLPLLLRLPLPLEIKPLEVVAQVRSRSALKNKNAIMPPDSQNTKFYSCPLIFPITILLLFSFLQLPCSLKRAM